MATHQGYARWAGSLVELLVVIAIVLLLLALLLPGLGGAREQVRRTMCSNNLRQWGSALQAYRMDFRDYLPTEGSYLSPNKPHTWFNVLPPYVDALPYSEMERIDGNIKELSGAHVWICPSKNLTGAYKSQSGKNQFHYGMNQVLDGMGSAQSPSPDTPDYPDLVAPSAAERDWPRLRGQHFRAYPNTIFMFDVARNVSAGSPREVAVQSYRDPQTGNRLGKFHGDYANLLYLHGGVAHCKADDLYSDRDNVRGRIVWRHPRLYWGYPPPGRSAVATGR